jgi:hypothetical protein
VIGTNLYFDRIYRINRIFQRSKIRGQQAVLSNEVS